MEHSYLSFVQAQIDQHLMELCKTYPKLEEFLSRYLEARETLCRIDPNGDNICRYFVEMAEMVERITCGYAYHRGQEVRRLTSQGVSCVPIEEPDLAGLLEARYFPDPRMVEEFRRKVLTVLSEPEQAQLKEWNRLWADRGSLLIGASLVWGYQAGGPLEPFGMDLWMQFHLHRTLRPFGAGPAPDVLS